MDEGQEKRSPGRPTLYSQAIADEICHRLIEGESLLAISRDESMPGKRTFFDWLEQHEDFRTQYTRARMIQTELAMDDLQEIADNGSNDWMERRRKSGEVEKVLNHEHVSRSKLRAETLQWRIQKLYPKKYGPKMDLTHGNPDGSALQPLVQVVFVDKDEET